MEIDGEGAKQAINNMLSLASGYDRSHGDRW